MRSCDPLPSSVTLRTIEFDQIARLSASERRSAGILGAGLGPFERPCFPFRPNRLVNGFTPIAEEMTKRLRSDQRGEHAARLSAAFGKFRAVLMTGVVGIFHVRDAERIAEGVERYVVCRSRAKCKRTEHQLENEQIRRDKRGHRSPSGQFSSSQLFPAVLRIGAIAPMLAYPCHEVINFVDAPLRRNAIEADSP
jgi:hypothetical protein